MKTIVFIDTQKSGSSREAIKAAERLGYYTVLLTNNPKKIKQRTEYHDVHLMKLCNTEDLDEMKDMIKKLQLRGLKIKAIVSFVDSRCYTASLLAKEFGLKHFTSDAIYLMENKSQSRNTLKDTQLIPKYEVLNPQMTYSEDRIKEYLPAIIKSSRSTGSKDVYKVNNYKEFNKQFNHFKNKYPQQSIIIEEYLDGPQYLTEVLVIDGVVHIIGIIEQEISYVNQHFIVTGYYLMKEKPEFYENLYNSVSRIIKAHGLKNGPCHLELRLIKGVWKLIEINPRISGGGMNHLIEYGTGINLVEETLKMLLDKEIIIEPKYKKCVYIQYTTIDEEGELIKVTGKNRTRRSKNVLSVYVKPRKGHHMKLPTSMGYRYAYVIAEGESREKAEIYAKEAIKEIKFHVKSISK